MLRSIILIGIKKEIIIALEIFMQNFFHFLFFSTRTTKKEIESFQIIIIHLFNYVREQNYLMFQL